MLSGLQGVDDLSVVPVVGRADADGIDVFVGEQVVVVDVALRIGAGLLLDEAADLLLLFLVDLADGDQIDLRPFLAEAGERLHVGSEATAAGADEADADAGVGVGGNSPGGGGRGARRADSGERGGIEKRPTGEIGRVHRIPRWLEVRGRERGRKKVYPPRRSGDRGGIIPLAHRVQARPMSSGRFPRGTLAGQRPARDRAADR